MYEIEFVDGRKLKVGETELVNVYNKHWRPNNGYKQVLPIFIKNFIKRSRYLYVDLQEPIEYEKKELLIPPYLLGALIADGGIAHQVIFSNTDKEILNRVAEESQLINGFLHQNNSKINTCDYSIIMIDRSLPGIKCKLKELGLFGLTSEYKFIPDTYKISSISQRLDLLKGLFDCDGYATKEGSVNYCTVSPKLAIDVQELIWGVGGIAKISTKLPWYTHKGEKRPGKPAYQVNVRMKNPEDLFYMSRKKGRALKNQQYRHRLRLEIKSAKEC